MNENSVGECSKCGAPIVKGYKNWQCPKCGTALSPTIVKKLGVFPEPDRHTSTDQDDRGKGREKATSRYGRVVSNRYRDAYLCSRVVVWIGSLFKIAGWIVGAVIIVAGFVFGLDDPNGEVLMFAGVVAGLFLGVQIYVGGIFLSAHGQLLKASLDMAVNGSPFLTDEERAIVMSL